ncbi:MAG: VOC family protein [Acidobacteriota bacterium]
MTKINPYLNFKGEAEEAFNFYKSAFGGEFSTVMRYGELPGFEEGNLAEEDGNKIVNIALPISDGHVLMGNDVVGEYVDKTISEINVSISVSPDSKEETEKIFNGLSAGGDIEMPLGDIFEGVYFGILKDKFGIRWLINYDYNK